MDPNTIDPLSSAIATSPGSGAGGVTSALGREDFLRLLVAKLENQDPLEPTQDTEFISQLATFSSLEQLIGVNDAIGELALGQATLINAQALNLIGKQALIDAGQTVRVESGVADPVSYTLPKPASTATLTIYGPDDRPLRAIDLELTSDTRHSLAWDGKDANGDALPDGDYRIGVTATDLQGEPMNVALYQIVSIDGVSFDGGSIQLLSGEREVPFEMILEFRSATAP